MFLVIKRQAEKDLQKKSLVLAFCTSYPRVRASPINTVKDRYRNFQRFNQSLRDNEFLQGTSIRPVIDFSCVSFVGML